MAGTMALIPGGYDGQAHNLTYRCTADAADASYFSGEETEPINGNVKRLRLTFGSPTPTNGTVDIVINDSDGIPVFLASDLLNVAVANPIEVRPYYADDTEYGHKYISGPLSVTISGNAVNGAVLDLKFTVQKGGED